MEAEGESCTGIGLGTSYMGLGKSYMGLGKSYMGLGKRTEQCTSQNSAEYSSVPKRRDMETFNFFYLEAKLPCIFSIGTVSSLSHQTSQLHHLYVAH